MSRRTLRLLSPALVSLTILAVVLVAMPLGAGAHDPGAGLPWSEVNDDQVLRGRQLVLSRGCPDCHGGFPNPASPDYLAGYPGPGPTDTIGGYDQYAPNLTPDPSTGIGRYTDRQLFNALRYGLRPKTSPDVEVTSATPGQGNHPARPDYLGPVMPWVSWRYLSDQELWDIIAYLRRGVRPVNRMVQSSEAPPDHWVEFYNTIQTGGPALPPFPAASEELRAPERRAQVLRGRQVVASTACGLCHGGVMHPGQPGWLVGHTPERPDLEFQIGPFKTRPRNLTPDNLTGLGRFSERQIFNAIRFGLRPGETADVEITSTVPGQGNHPISPKYMAIPMPWPAWRHLPDEDIRAIAAYLKFGLKPVRNLVADSEGPPDFWASEYTNEKVGSWPAPPFPAARERNP